MQGSAVFIIDTPGAPPRDDWLNAVYPACESAKRMYLRGHQAAAKHARFSIAHLNRCAVFFDDGILRQLDSLPYELLRPALVAI